MTNRKPASPRRATPVTGSVSRRQLLRGLSVGLPVTLGLPLLDLMMNDHGTALAQGEPLARRFGTFFWGNGRGIDRTRWAPTATGTAWELSAQLAPLEVVKPYINLVTNSDIKLQNSPRGHHNGVAGFLTGADFIAQDPGNAGYRSTLAGPSIDQIAADTLSAGALYRSVEVGVSRQTVNGEGTTLQYISHNGPDNANPSPTDPIEVFDRLFGDTSGGQDTSVLTATNEIRQSILDSVKEDITALKARVGSRDRTRLDQHFENIRAVELRLGANAALASQCTNLTRPEVPRIDGGREPITELTAAMSQMLALATACDMTRVFSMLFTGSVGSTIFWQVGADRGHHDLSHEADATQDVIDASTIYTMEQFAVLLNTFQTTPDGAGNLLDSSVIIASSDCSDGAAHSVSDYPIVIAGSAGGSLKYPGVHVDVNGDNTSKALLTVLRAVGVNAMEFGGGAGHVTETFTDIEA